MKPRKFRKRPVVIEAVQFDGNNHAEVEEFCTTGTGTNFSRVVDSLNFHKKIIIYTREGKLNAVKGDWIIKGVKGEFYPCGPEIFEMTYEEVK